MAHPCTLHVLGTVLECLFRGTAARAAAANVDPAATAADSAAGTLLSAAVSGAAAAAFCGGAASSVASPNGDLARNSAADAASEFPGGIPHAVLDDTAAAGAEAGEGAEAATGRDTMLHALHCGMLGPVTSPSHNRDRRHALGSYPWHPGHPWHSACAPKVLHHCCRITHNTVWMWYM